MLQLLVGSSLRSSEARNLRKLEAAARRVVRLRLAPVATACGHRRARRRRAPAPARRPILRVTLQRLLRIPLGALTVVRRQRQLAQQCERLG